MKKSALALAVLAALMAGCNDNDNDNDNVGPGNVVVNKPDSWYDSHYYMNTNGHETTFGWWGDRDALVAYRDGSFYIRDGVDKRVGFGLYNNRTKMDWYNQDGYLPVMISEFILDEALVKIMNFANKVTVDGNDYVIAYSRIQVTNPLDYAIAFDPVESPEFTALNVARAEVQPGETVSYDFAVAADRFGKNIPRLTEEQILASGSWDENHAQMKDFWDKKLNKLIQFEKLPDKKLIDAFKTGYVYTQIVRDDNDLHVGESGPYDKVFDHDSIGILVALLHAGDFDDAKKLMDELQGVTQYDDAKYKYAWVFAVYYQKTGDLEYVKSKFEEIKGFVRLIETDRTGPGGIMKETHDIDSLGSWTITNYSALFGLVAYDYLAGIVGESGEQSWARDQYQSLYNAVESTLDKTVADNNLDYIPAGMLKANYDIPRLAEPRDANWASHFMFGRWSWDGYLFGADQSSASGSGQDGVMITKLDDTYKWGFERLQGILPEHNFGGYPHGWHSSSYNAGYGAAGLRGQHYRDEGIRAYQYMIENTMSGPFAWWEAIDTPSSETSWEGTHPIKGGETDRSGNSSPHMWGQSVATKVLINSLVAEMMNGDVIIGRGIPDEWLKAGEEIKISNIPIANNKRFAYHLVAGEQEVTIEFSGDQPEGEIFIDLPAFVGGKILSTSLGSSVIDNTIDRVTVPKDTKKVTIQYSAECSPPDIAVENWFENSTEVTMELGEQMSVKCDTIYYTTDGSEPKVGSKQYTGAFEVIDSSLIKAMVTAADDGVLQSTVETAVSIASGEGTGIQGFYYTGIFKELMYTEVNEKIDFSWNNGSPNYEVLGNDNYSIEWKGLLDIKMDGDYYFETVSNDGIRVYIDGELIIDKWWLDFNGAMMSQDISLKAGKVPVVVKYIENVGDANVKLSMGGRIDGAVLKKNVIPEGMYHLD